MQAADRRGEKQVVYHLMRVDALSIAIVVGIVVALAYLLVYLVATFAFHFHFINYSSQQSLPLELSYILLAFAGGFLNALLGAALFNFIAPKLGGVGLWLSEELCAMRKVA